MPKAPVVVPNPEVEGYVVNADPNPPKVDGAAVVVVDTPRPNAGFYTLDYY